MPVAVSSTPAPRKGGVEDEGRLMTSSPIEGESYLRNSLPLVLRRWEGFASGTSQKTYLLLFTRFVTCRTTGQVKTNFIRQIHFRRTALGIFSRWLALAHRQNDVLS